MAATPARQTPTQEMTSIVYWVLLGLVIERQSYGLELYHRLQRLYGDVLSVKSESHIYGALNSLEKRELIETVPGTRVGRQPKPHYKATQHGLDSYVEWLVAHVTDEKHRQELWVRQLGIFADDPDAAFGLVGRFEEQHLKGVVETIRLPDTPRDSRAELIEDLVAERQRLADGGMLSWLHYAEDRIAARAGRSHADDPPET
ncbi:MAG: PadR family transcriptional regulator [Solirubrobacteraceae bacterium]